MTNSNYKRCNKCIMDTTDPKITFNEAGVCSHCINFEQIASKFWYPNEVGKEKLLKIVKSIKKENKENSYDCILGLSGGLDSSYLALMMKELGLRPLVLHIDAGWNSDIAVSNINKITDYCGFNLKTITIDWDELKNLHIAFLKAGVANQDTVQDHAFFGALYKFAIKNKIKYVISGGNIATECILPVSWGHSSMDSAQIIDINRRFGNKKLENYPLVNFYEYYFYFPYIKKMRVLRPLNYIPYSKEIAIQKLKEIGFTPYERKHGESIFTKFFQNYYLPTHFGWDKRLAHFSSMITTGLMSRDQALEEMKKPLYFENELLKDKKHIAKKLELELDELEKLISSPKNSYKKFENWENKMQLLKKTKNFVEKITKRKVSNYS